MMRIWSVFLHLRLNLVKVPQIVWVEFPLLSASPCKNLQLVSQKHDSYVSEKALAILFEYSGENSPSTYIDASARNNMSYAKSN